MGTRDYIYVYTRKQSFQSIPGSGSARRPSRLLCISLANVHKYSYMYCTQRYLHIIITIGRQVCDLQGQFFCPTQSPVLKLYIYIYTRRPNDGAPHYLLALCYTFIESRAGLEAQEWRDVGGRFYRKGLSRVIEFYVVFFSNFESISDTPVTVHSKLSTRTRVYT